MKIGIKSRMLLQKTGNKKNYKKKKKNGISGSQCAVSMEVLNYANGQFTH